MDRAFAAACCLVCSPIWLIRVALKSLMRRELPTLANDPRSGILTLNWLGSETRLSLLTVCLGRLALVGPELGSPAARLYAPGLCSPERLQSSMGLEATEDDGKFFAHAGFKSRLALVCRTYFVGLYGAPKIESAHSEVRVFGVQFANTSMADAVSTITGYCDMPGAMQRVFFVNADCLNVAYGDRDYHYLLHDADLVLPDGSGVRLALKSLGTSMMDNLNGTDLFPKLCEAAQDAGLSFFFLGGAPGTTDNMVENLKHVYPHLEIAGWRDGYFSDVEAHEVVEQINASGADILLVGMGAPRQERWLSDHAADLQTKVGVGVGGLFDFYSGEVERAPLWLRELGLEWVWRIVQQPGDKWRRYVVGNPVFLTRVMVQRLSLGGRSWLALGRSKDDRMDNTANSRSFLNGLKRRAELYWWQSTLIVPKLLKRLIDIVLCGAAIVIFSPLYMFLAACVRLTSPGPILFKQMRVGERGKTFSMWKFRSMYQDAEQLLESLRAQNESPDNVLFKMADDPRITRVGKWMRRFSLDELPQLFNVLQGSMTLVGPRPALPAEVDNYQASHLKRLQVKPGITCWWQVSGRSELSFQEQMELDVDYLSGQSISQDLGLLARTLPAVLGGKGAS